METMTRTEKQFNGETMSYETIQVTYTVIGRRNSKRGVRVTLQHPHGWCCVMVVPNS